MAAAPMIPSGWHMRWAPVIWRGNGYGGAIRTAFEDINARWLLTMDAVFYHRCLSSICLRRHEGEIIIASRYAAQGYAEMPWTRKFLSYTLNWVFGRILSLPVRDLSSGFRLYHRNAIGKLDLRYETYAVLQEILAKAYCRGYRVIEEPFHYRPPPRFQSCAGIQIRCRLPESLHMWARNNLDSADHGTPFATAFRCNAGGNANGVLSSGFVADRMRVLDVGCGSSQLLNSIPKPSPDSNRDN